MRWVWQNCGITVIIQFFSQNHVKPINPATFTCNIHAKDYYDTNNIN